MQYSIQNFIFIEELEAVIGYLGDIFFKFNLYSIFHKLTIELP